MDNPKITTDHINAILGVKESYQAPDRLWEILRSKTERERAHLAEGRATSIS